MSNCEITSGGVKIAAIMKEHKTAYLRVLRIRSAVITPIRAKKKVKSGISKIRPKAMSNFMEKPKYSLKDGMAAISSLAKPTKKVKAYGKTMKKQKEAPAMKNPAEIPAMGIIYFFSSSYRPGEIKLHI